MGKLLKPVHGGSVSNGSGIIRNRNRIGAIRRRASGDPRSYFFGEPAIDVDPADVAAVEPGTDVAEAVLIDSVPEDSAAQQLASAYQSLSPQEKAATTLLPPLAVWNAMVNINPLLGKISAEGLNYNLLKALNEMPFQGQTFSAGAVNNVATVTITSTESAKLYAVPWIRFTISNSQLQTPAGGLVTLRFRGVDANGNEFSTLAGAAGEAYAYTFQRMMTTMAVTGIFIPFNVVATRTLPFMPVFRKEDATVQQPAITVTFEFSGLNPNDMVYVTVPGYATAELREVSQMYNTPAGLLH